MNSLRKKIEIIKENFNENKGIVLHGNDEQTKILIFEKTFVLFKKKFPSAEWLDINYEQDSSAIGKIFQISFQKNIKKIIKIKLTNFLSKSVLKSFLENMKKAIKIKTNFLIILAPYLNKENSMFKKLSSLKCFLFINCYTSENERKEEILNILKENKITSGERARNLLFNKLPNDIHFSYQEIKKLIMFIYPKKKIEEKDIQKCLNISLHEEYEENLLVNSLLERNKLVFKKILSRIKKRSNYSKLLWKTYYQAEVIRKTILNPKEKNNLSFYIRINLEKQIKTWSLIEICRIIHMLCKTITDSTKYYEQTELFCRNVFFKIIYKNLD